MDVAIRPLAVEHVAVGNELAAEPVAGLVAAAVAAAAVVAANAAVAADEHVASTSVYFLAARVAHVHAAVLALF